MSRQAKKTVDNDRYSGYLTLRRSALLTFKKPREFRRAETIPGRTVVTGPSHCWVVQTPQARIYLPAEAKVVTGRNLDGTYQFTPTKDLPSVTEIWVEGKYGKLRPEQVRIFRESSQSLHRVMVHVFNYQPFVCVGGVAVQLEGEHRV